jgi:DNA-binding transcriptional LysR family regulator
LAHLYGPELAKRYAERRNLDFLFQAYTDDRFSDLEANRFDLLLDAEFRALPATLKSEVLFEEELVRAVDKESPYGKKLSLAQYVAVNHVCISVLENQQTVPDIALNKVGAARRCAFTIPYFSVALNMVAGTSLMATLSGIWQRVWSIPCTQDWRRPRPS